MIVSIKVLAFAATLLSSKSLIYALSASDIPGDTPISSLLSSANAHLAKGETNDALTYYDVAISRDPENYLTIFKRGAAYLSLGRTGQALQDFDKVLLIKPGFEGALLQRARIKGKNGEWESAKKDYISVGKTETPEFKELEEAQGAAKLAFDAEAKKAYEECVSLSSAAILVASKNLALRQLRVRCRFEKGEVQEGISDLAHVLQMQPGLIEPHLQISSINFFALKDTDRGLAQIRKCLHSDPDSKPCKKLYVEERSIEKLLAKVTKSIEKAQFSSSIKILVGTADEPGLIQQIKDAVAELRSASTIPPNAPNELVAKVVEMACQAYSDVNPKKAIAYCDEALQLDENSLYGLLFSAQRSMDAENFEAAINTLNTAKEHHPGAQKVQEHLQKAEIALRRSKEKDYYKVLGVPHDADERQIKAAYRKMTKLHHPDKAIKRGISKEDAEKKMAAINEAYEVLSDPELKARFDAGDDPNSNEQRGNPFHGSPFGNGQQFFQQAGSQGGPQFQFKFSGGQGFPGGGFPGGFPFG